nr:hypothetical protein [uncultured Porphyromonas sp.]
MKRVVGALLDGKKCRVHVSFQDRVQEPSSPLDVQQRSLWGVYDGLPVLGWCDRQAGNPHIEDAVIDTSSSNDAMIGYSSGGHSQGYGDVSFGLMKLEKSPALIIIPIIDIFRREAETKERLVE